MSSDEVGEGGRMDVPTGWERLVALVALPRSGTTVTTAVLGAHSDVYEVYEPWNANKATLDAAEPMSYAAFLERFVPPQRDRSTLLVKETTTSGKYLERIVQLLDEAPATTRKTLILLLRNPFHVFFSECEARRRWWGATDLVADLPTFDKWADRTQFSFRRLAAAAETFNALCVSYEALVTAPDTMAQLMEGIGLAPEDRREDYSEHIDVKRIRGDLNVSEDAQAMHGRSVAAREAEFAALRPLLRQSSRFPAIRQISHQVSMMKPITPISAAKPLLRALKGERADGTGPLARAPKQRT